MPDPALHLVVFLYSYCFLQMLPHKSSSISLYCNWYWLHQLSNWLTFLSFHQTWFPLSKLIYQVVLSIINVQIGFHWERILLSVEEEKTKLKYNLKLVYGVSLKKYIMMKRGYCPLWSQDLLCPLAVFSPTSKKFDKIQYLELLQRGQLLYFSGLPTKIFQFWGEF